MRMKAKNSNTNKINEFCYGLYFKFAAYVECINHLIQEQIPKNVSVMFSKTKTVSSKKIRDVVECF